MMIDPLKIVWLASYPKSGNTWVRFLLYHYFNDSVKSSTALGKFAPDIHNLPNRKLGPEYSGRVFCKTHFTWVADHPYTVETNAFIYIVRNPKDVLLSNLNYLRLLGNQPIDAKIFADQFISHKGLAHWRKFGMGSWPEHFHSWLNQNPARKILVRYEDLLADPATGLTKILEFLNETPRPDRVKQAVKASNFESMRTLEENERKSGTKSLVFPHNPAAFSKDIFFMNGGKTTGTLSSIDPGLDEQFDIAFGEYMNRFGY